jgi:transposase
MASQEQIPGNGTCYIIGFDHGAGHPFLFLDDAKAPNCRKNNGFKDLGNYSEWPKLAGAVIKATLSAARSWRARIGWVEFWHSRDIEGTVKNVTVSRQGKHWCVAFQVEQDLPEPVHPASAEVGIDLGVATFAAFSDGTVHPPLNAYRRVDAKKARMQRKLAGMVKYSQNWKKQ